MVPRVCDVATYDPSAGFVTGGGWIDSPTRRVPLRLVPCRHGEVRVSGEPGCGFFLTSIDAGVNRNDAHEVDRFRIKIWELGTEAVVYDNRVECSDDSLHAGPCTAIGDGNILVYRR